MFERMKKTFGIKAHEFPKNFQWLNTKEPLSLEKLKGHVVILDFWTYCCINCMHTLPELAKIEQKYKGKPVVVVGVHSAKFFNEQDASNIQQAILRYEIEHPVVVDKNMQIWQSYGMSGWPTIEIIDPVGNIVYKQSGEGQREYIEDVVDVLLENHGKAGTLADRSLYIERPKIADRKTLSYPGKLAFSPDGKMIVVSDSNHNRILVLTINGKITYTIGSGERALVDGNFEKASFFRPQGVLWKDEKLYVADTENHALREIDLAGKMVSTLAGTGKQGQWMQAGGEGRTTSLSSPWDLACKDKKIFIAMAGNHQIWAYNLENGKVEPFAGSGYENIVDSNLLDAQFAQPSGLSLNGNYLFVADSEVSGVRRIDLEQKIVRTIVGEGLFVFGHQDGDLSEARFQHPLGLHADGNRIFVADTYNHAIRLIDLVEGKVTTLVGKPSMKTVCNIDDPSCDTLGLFEPSDVKLHDNKLYIADTNNHLIRVFDLERKVLQTLNISE
ncbi:MAG: thiol-disulfide isomerase/thioredoxin [Candidatus Nitrosomirales archaeon]|jgi:thiol-disulfide isomerase/thioredoxin